MFQQLYKVLFSRKTSLLTHNEITIHFVFFNYLYLEQIVNRQIKAMRTAVITLLALFILNSCADNYGKHVKLDNVTVYYKEPVNKNQAIALADYWINNDFNGRNPQYLQLEEVENKLILKLIPTDSTYLDELPYETKIMLLMLEDELNYKLFKGNNLSIHLSDSQFNKITSIKD